jgi:hypothetical protein
MLARSMSLKLPEKTVMPRERRRNPDKLHPGLMDYVSFQVSTVVPSQVSPLLRREHIHCGLSFRFEPLETPNFGMKSDLFLNVPQLIGQLIPLHLLFYRMSHFWT